MFKNKKLLIGIAVGFVLLLVAIGYFVVTPAMQVASYKQQAMTAHTKVSDATNKLTAMRGKDAFVKTDVESAVVRSDVKAGQDAIKDLESALASYEKQLTDFNALPLLDFNSQYKTAGQIKGQELEYVKNIREYVTEMRAVLEYLDKSSVITDKLKEVSSMGDALATATTSAELLSRLNTVIAKYDNAIAEYEKIVAPASLNEMHIEAVVMAKDLSSLLKEMSAVVKSESYEKMTGIYNRLLEKQTAITTRGTELNDKFMKESVLAKLSDKLKDLHREIEANFAKL